MSRQGNTDPGWVTLTFSYAGTWSNPSSTTGLVIHAQGGVNGGSTSCFTYTQEDKDANCTPTDVVPEPITVLLLGSGLAGMGGAGFLRRRRGEGAGNG